MNHSANVTAELDQADEAILHEVSDEALEVAAGACIEGQSMVTLGQRSWSGDAADCVR
jgi:hypothetical protein